MKAKTRFPCPSVLTFFALALVGALMSPMELRGDIPPRWEGPLDLGIQKEGMAFEIDLKTFLLPPLPTRLTIESPNLPSWMSMTAQGILRGTPQRPHVGRYQNIKFIAKGDGSSDQTSASGEVLKTVTPPQWKANPITLESVESLEKFKINLVSWVEHVEESPLFFELLNGPSWVELTQSGELFGYPQITESGSYPLLVQVRTTIDHAPYTHTTRLILPVSNTNQAPKWVASPLVLPSAMTGEFYEQDLSKSVNDNDGPQDLQFALKTPSRWITLTPEGILQGRPAVGDVGDHELIVGAFDGELESSSSVQIRVTQSNQPPYWKQSQMVLPSINEGDTFQYDLTDLSSDPDGDVLKYTKLSGPNFVEIGEIGNLFAQPQPKDIGVHEIEVLVSDGKSGNAKATLRLEVKWVAHAPIWSANPLQLALVADQSFKENLKHYVTDEDLGDSHIFSLMSGPSWVSLTPSGLLSGMPPWEEMTERNWKTTLRAKVTDAHGLSAEVSIVLSIKQLNQTPKWKATYLEPQRVESNEYLEFDLTPYAFDPDEADTLKFYKASGPEWLIVTPSGLLAGTPRNSDIGMSVTTIRVADSKQASAVTQIQVEVVAKNIAPRWRQSPVYLKDAFINRPYHFDLAPYAVDDGGETLTFKLIEGPPWMRLSATGILSGTPGQSASLKVPLLTLEVSDGIYQVRNTAELIVHASNQPPTLSEEVFVLQIVKSKPMYTADLKTSAWVSDPEGDELSFYLSDSTRRSIRAKEVRKLPSWIRLSLEGSLRITTQKAPIGKHTFELRVDDGNHMKKATLIVEMLP